MAILLVLFSANFLLFSIPSSLSLAHPHMRLSNVTDQQSLLEFKAAITSDPLHSLATWNPNTSFCNWTGVVCSSRRQRVVALNLWSMALEGSISPFLGNLSLLRSLSLANNTLHGPIPPQLGRLFRLRELQLLINKFEGRIPTAFANCRNLEELDLSFNSFSGSILPELGFLTRLKRLYLAANSLTGAVPSFLGNLSALTELVLSENGLEGAIPVELEYGFAAPISTKGDVYSFGTILMEMLTKKRPIDDMFVNGLTLQKWVSMAFSNNILEVVDSSLLSCSGDEGMSPDHILNCLNQLIRLALLCTNESPEKRPNMREIVDVLERIRGTFIGTIRTPWLQPDISHLLSCQIMGDHNVGIVGSQSSST